MLPNPQSILEHLRQLQWQILQTLIKTRGDSALHHVDHASSADFIYRVDTLIEPVLVEFCEQWSRSLPLVLIAEGVEPETGRAFPTGSRPEDAQIVLIIDPIDGTRSIMYDKRSAWSLAGVAPNRGPATRLRDIELAVMTELPTSKGGLVDVLWASKGRGAAGERINLFTSERCPLELNPSTRSSIDHGFASISNFFPVTKVLGAQAMEFLAQRLIDPQNITRGSVFEDQYITTGGQFYELIVGHDLFIADLRSLFYPVVGGPMGLCAHPYDCATALIAEEAGVILTDGLGNPLDGPMDVTTGLSWAGFANRALHDRIQPLLRQFLREHGCPGA